MDASRELDYESVRPRNRSRPRRSMPSPSRRDSRTMVVEEGLGERERAVTLSAVSSRRPEAVRCDPRRIERDKTNHNMEATTRKIAAVIFDSITDGVFTTDHDCRITSFNRAAEQMTGFTRQQAVGRYCFDIFRTEICQSRCAPASHAGGRKSRLERPCYHRDPRWSVATDQRQHHNPARQERRSRWGG